MIRRLWGLSLLLLLAILLPSSGVRAQQRTMVVAIERDYPPFTFVNEEGAYAGFSIELMDAIAETGGFEVEYKVAEFVYLIPGVATRLYDAAISCIFIRPERQALVDFSDPHYAGGLWLISTANSGIHTIDDLTPTSKVGTVRGTAGEIYIREQHLPVDLVLADFANQAFDLLAEASVVAVLYERESMMAYQALYPEVQLQAVGNPLTIDECGIAVNKGELRLLLTINAVLAKMREDGRYDQIYHKWFGDLKPVTGTETAVPNTAQPQTPPIVGSPSVTTSPPVSATATITSSTAAMNQVTGVYYLSLPTDPARYQIATLTADGLWLGAETGPTTGPTAPRSISVDGFSAQQQGIWQINPDNQLRATVLSFALPDATSQSVGLLRQEYGMMVDGSGQVTGNYTATVYNLAQDPLDATTTPVETVTVEFTGQRLQAFGDKQ